MFIILFYISRVHLLCPSIHIPSPASEATQGVEFHVLFIVPYTSLPLPVSYSKSYPTWLLTFSTMIRVHDHQVSVTSLCHFQPQAVFWVLHLLLIINIEYMTLSTLLPARLSSALQLWTVCESYMQCIEFSTTKSWLPPQFKLVQVIISLTVTDSFCLSRSYSSHLHPVSILLY